MEIESKLKHPKTSLIKAVSLQVKKGYLAVTEKTIKVQYLENENIHFGGDHPNINIISKRFDDKEAEINSVKGGDKFLKRQRRCIRQIKDKWAKEKFENTITEYNSDVDNNYLGKNASKINDKTTQVPMLINDNYVSASINSLETNLWNSLQEKYRQTLDSALENKDQIIEILAPELKQNFAKGISNLKEKDGNWKAPKNLNVFQPLGGESARTGVSKGGAEINFNKETDSTKPENLKNHIKYFDDVKDPSANNSKLTRMHLIRGRFHGPKLAKNMFLGTKKSNNYHKDSHFGRVESSISSAIEKYKKDARVLGGAEWYVNYSIVPSYDGPPQYIKNQLNTKYKNNQDEYNDHMDWWKEAAPTTYAAKWQLVLRRTDDDTKAKIFEDEEPSLSASVGAP